MAAEQEMRDFTRGLFQGSPDLRVLTLAMVRRKYLAHVGRESLVREEKQLLKELVKEELLRMQLDGSSSEGGSPSPRSTRDAPQAGAQKRPHSSSQSWGETEDMARKKQRLDQGSEASSDGEDSGIDSRKPKLAPAEEDAGKCGHTGSCEDEGDSGAENTPDRGGTSRESSSEWAARNEGTKQPPRRRPEGAEAQDQQGKKRAREAEQRGDCGGQKEKANGGITAQTEEESGSESPVEEEECKRQKQTGKTGPRKTKWRSDSEEEGRLKARGKAVGSDAEVDEKCQGRKGAGKKGRRKAGRWSDSEEEENKEKIKDQREEESGSEEEEGRSRKPAGKTGMKKVERRSDSEAEEVGSRKKRTKPQSEEESGSEEEEGVSRKEKGTGKAERGSEEEEEGEGEGKAERGSEEEEEGEGKAQARQRGSSETHEDSSSSSSAQDENSTPNPGSRRKKGKAPGSRGASLAEEHPAVRRLKRYILACGVRRNYKKLLAGCRSVKQRVGVLRRELEAIGLQGNPSLERCRALRLRREEAAEVAALDVGNIIASEGRPRRCNIWSLYSTPPAVPPARRPVDWSSLRGVVSSDEESD